MICWIYSLVDCTVLLTTFPLTKLVKTGYFCVRVPSKVNIKFTPIICRYDDIYEVTVEYKDGVEGGDFRQSTLKESVTKFVDEKGTVREDLFMPRIKQLCVSLQKDKKQK